MDFKVSLQNEREAIAVDFSDSKKVLLIAFGGFADRLGIPMFEFNKVTKGMRNINKIYLRDKHRLWYHKGLPGISKNIRETADFLRKYTTHPSIRRTVTIGTSGGGYAALLFGHILNCTEIHAFSPKTFISPLKRIICKDHSSHVSVRKLFELVLVGNRKYFDIKFSTVQMRVKTSHKVHSR